MTLNLIADKPRSVGRKAKNFTDEIFGRFPTGTKARILEALDDGETMTDFLQTAVERELKRRARKAS